MNEIMKMNDFTEDDLKSLLREITKRTNNLILDVRRHKNINRIVHLKNQITFVLVGIQAEAEILQNATGKDLKKFIKNTRMLRCLIDEVVSRRNNIMSVALKDIMDLIKKLPNIFRR